MLPRSPRYRLIVLLIAALTVAVAVNRASRQTNDFDGFHRAAQQVVQDRTLSDQKSVRRYLPSFPVLLAPLGLVPVEAAAVLWALLNLLAMAALPGELTRLCGVSRQGMVPAFLITAPFLVDNMVLGQSGPLILYLIVAGVARCRRRGGLAGGLLLGLAAAVKVIPALLLVVPVLLGRAKGALAGFALALALSAGLCLATVGAEQTSLFLGRWRTEVANQSPQRMVELSRSLRFSNQSLPITLARTFGDLGPARSRGAVKLASLPLPVIWALAGAILAALAALGLAGALAARRLGGDRAWEGLTALGCLGLLLASPLVWTHYFLLALPGFVAVRSRPRLLRRLGTVFALGVAFPPLRSLGLHIVCVAVLFVIIALDLLREVRTGTDGPQPVS